MELDTVAKIVSAFYRLVGSVTADQSLTEQGESADDVAYLNLTRGSRSAQRWMLDVGFGGWRQRSSALAFTGSDDVDGGRYVTTMPTDFLRAYGSNRRSGMVEANGDRWGTEILEAQDHLWGDHYYFVGQVLWLARTASPPTVVYLDYHYTHPAWTSGVAIDFPMEARHLIPAYAAGHAVMDNWVSGGDEMEGRVSRALKAAQSEARSVARPTKSTRKFKRPTRISNRW